MFTFCLSVLVYICPNQIIFPVFPFALFLHLFWHFTATATSWRFTKWLTVAEQCVCFSGPVVKDKWWNFLYSPAFLKLQLCDKSLAQGKNLYVCASFTLCHYVCVCVCVVLYMWVLKGFRLHSAEFVCLLLSTVYIVFPVSVNVHVIFVCLCLQASQQGFFCCSPADWTDRVGFSYHSNCYMLRLPLCLHPKNITHPHTHTGTHKCKTNKNNLSRHFCFT